MARKSTAASTVPTTVAERRRLIRGTKEPVSRSIRKVEIDLTKPDARRALVALYPRPENETIIESTPELEAAALQYVEARDAATLANERKEAAGNLLCNAIARNLGVAGAGWKAEWDETKGGVDWTRLAKDLAIADDVIAKYRKPASRTLTVRELADDAT